MPENEDLASEQYRRFRVELRSAPGPWTFYSGHVDVLAADIDSAFLEAVQKLARTSFPDRPSVSSWRCLGVSLL